ncbi:hypothetical protein AB838_01965 [Rhodobacteraceae bacterium (ex Bugula neritina AB1)]|nr:hypothetical protein AB838_01965 [Rhodobacteraceae bacterium (ex Bugula neritina AB1)]
MNDHAFKLAAPDNSRVLSKPRVEGLTMMMDAGLPLGAQRDWLGFIAPFVDMVKLVTGTAALYPEAYLREKLSLYREHDIKPFIGGNFLENVFAQKGFDGAEALFTECRSLGIEAIEVSDTVVPIATEDRLALMKLAQEIGLHAHAEVGSKLDETSTDKIQYEIELLMDAGAHIITVEGAELMQDGVPNTVLCEQISTRFDQQKILFELCGPWLKGTHNWEAFAVMRFLVETFGAHVNIGNALPEMVVEIEAQRRGLNE